MKYYYCNICKVKITDRECSYSMDHYKKPLCRTHQDQAKLEAERSANEQKISPKEPEPKINYSVVTKPMPPIDFLLEWLKQWVIDKSVNLSMDSKQFFLSGPELEELARDVIGKAQDEILVTSPYVDSCHLATTLQRAVERRVKVKVVARRPENTKNDVPKAEYQANLRKEGVIIHYNNQIHSKIIVIDRKIAIISSMNLYSGSTGGATLEAGIVSFDKAVADSAVKYIIELLEKQESSDPTAIKTTTYWKNRRY
jgi:phosphatidylserine/phosphatidylglycerophosphate/cardiolipin synthase-like enzyme